MSPSGDSPPVQVDHDRPPTCSLCASNVVSCDPPVDRPPGHSPHQRTFRTFNPLHPVRPETRDQRLETRDQRLDQRPETRD
ncbi:hypothetical protein EYF80_064380 [Liparis tanakae]|uniref:Uncharacterized protein n=1 Tax=Liparis tanakae TaxID=230148 RepID=A0A4Z2EAB3_9TELE|nr:hypothetical protein EYF80_064380 [Liparis tanakae]